MRKSNIERLKREIMKEEYKQEEAQKIMKDFFFKKH